MNVRRTIITMTAATCIATSGTVWSHSALDPAVAGNMETLTEKSNLVVHGEVAQVDYVRVSENGEVVPYTRVTYKVKETLRGKAEGQTLTLQFPGGADGMGGFLGISGVPVFQKGDEDILFVENNGEASDCPLVNCEYGRYRVDQNKIYNTHGQPVRGIKANNAVARGKRAAKFNSFSYPTPKFDDLMKNPKVKALLKKRGMTVKQARAEYDKSAPKQITLFADAPSATSKDAGGKDPQEAKVMKEVKGARGPQEEKVIGAGAISMASFVSKIKALEKKAKRKPASMKSARKTGPIKARKIGLVKAAAAPKPRAEKKQASAADEAEVKALKAQGFNPVLKPKK